MGRGEQPLLGDTYATNPPAGQRQTSYGQAPNVAYPTGDLVQQRPRMPEYAPQDASVRSRHSSYGPSDPYGHAEPNHHNPYSAEQSVASTVHYQTPVIPAIQPGQYNTAKDVNLPSPQLGHSDTQVPPYSPATENQNQNRGYYGGENVPLAEGTSAANYYRQAGN